GLFLERLRRPPARFWHGPVPTMNGAGRIRTRCRRCFVAAGGRPGTTGELVCWIWPRRSTFTTTHYKRAREPAREIAEPGPYPRRGRNSRAPGSLNWTLRAPVERPCADVGAARGGHGSVVPGTHGGDFGRDRGGGCWHDDARVRVGADNIADRGCGPRPRRDRPPAPATTTVASASR